MVPSILIIFTFLLVKNLVKPSEGSCLTKLNSTIVGLIDVTLEDNSPKDAKYFIDKKIVHDLTNIEKNFSQKIKKKF